MAVAVMGTVWVGIGLGTMDGVELVVDDEAEAEAENEDFLFLPMSGLKFVGKETPFPYPARTASLSFPVD
jgi:hypothetical protein